MIPNYVVIPFLGKIDMTFDLVRQLSEPKNEVKQIFLMNNGERESFPWSNGNYNATTLQCKGWNLHKMWNHGIDAAYVNGLTKNKNTSKVNVAVLNNDLVLEVPDYIALLSDGLRSSPQIAMIGGTPYQWDGLANTVGRTRPGVGHRGEAVMLKAEMPFRFDERFEWWRGDDDIVAQIENAGYVVAVCTAAKHTHIDGGGQTAKHMDPEDFQAKVERDTARLYRKWPQMRPGELVIPEDYLML